MSAIPPAASGPPPAPARRPVRARDDDESRAAFGDALALALQPARAANVPAPEPGDRAARSNDAAPDDGGRGSSTVKSAATPAREPATPAREPAASGRENAADGRTDSAARPDAPGADDARASGSGEDAPRDMRAAHGSGPASGDLVTLVKRGAAPAPNAPAALRAAAEAATARAASEAAIASAAAGHGHRAADVADAVSAIESRPPISGATPGSIPARARESGARADRDGRPARAARPSAAPRPAPVAPRAETPGAARPDVASAPAPGADTATSGKPDAAGPTASASASPSAPGTPDGAMRPGSPEFVTIRLDGAQGLEGTLRVAVRGAALRATIVASDADAARRLEGNVGDLRRALAERGFGDPRIVVRSAPAAEPGPRADTKSESRPEPQARHPRSEHRDPPPRERPDSSDPRSRRRTPRESSERQARP